MDLKYTVFLPCRLGSQRIANKNIKKFAGIDGGLLAVKLNQLLCVNKIDELIVSSNDERVLDFAIKKADSRITIDERPNSLGQSSTTTDDLIKYVPNIVDEGIVIWTHVTSPFFSTEDYNRSIIEFENSISEGYDSLMTVSKIQGFLWNECSPINYDKEKLKWPMTQSIDPIYEVDSSIFISNINNYINYSDRIGIKPYLLVNEKIKSIDIDWPEDFELAEIIYEAHCKKNF